MQEDNFFGIRKWCRHITCNEVFTFGQIRVKCPFDILGATVLPVQLFGQTCNLQNLRIAQALFMAPVVPDFAFDGRRGGDIRDEFKMFVGDLPLDDFHENLFNREVVRRYNA